MQATGAGYRGGVLDISLIDAAPAATKFDVNGKTASIGVPAGAAADRKAAVDLPNLAQRHLIDDQVAYMPELLRLG